MNSELDSRIEQSPSVSGLTSQAGDNDLNLQILAELKHLGGRMTAMEQRMSDTSPMEVNQRSYTSHVPSTSATNPSPAQLDEIVVPSVAVLQGTPSHTGRSGQKDQASHQIKWSRQIKITKGRQWYGLGEKTDTVASKVCSGGIINPECLVIIYVGVSGSRVLL